jgi:Ca2+-binding RTX toxin-like protein
MVINGDFILAAGAAFTAPSGDDVALAVGGFSAPPARIIIDGRLQIEGSSASANQAIAIRYEAGGTRPDILGVITIGASGVMRAIADFSVMPIGVAYGFRSEVFYDLRNDGRIEVVGRATAVGVYSLRDPNRIVNNGTLQVQGDYANAVQSSYGGLIANTGLIEVFGGASAYGISQGSTFAGSSSLTNSGVIRVRDTSSASTAVGVSTAAWSGVINSGTIDAEVAVQLGGSDFSRAIPLINTGHLTGAVVGTFARVDIANSGGITGDVRLGPSDDRYDGRLGTVTGVVSGGGGADTLMGGVGAESLSGGSGGDVVAGGLGSDSITDTGGFNYLRGDEGNDSIAGGADFDDINGNMGDDYASGGLGDDWVVGGRDNDRLFGDAGNDLVYGNLGNDTCEGGEGNDIVRGGQGDDVVTAGAGADFVSGDLGSDTLTGGAGADIFNTFAETGLDRVTDFSVAEGDRVQLAPGTTYTLAQVGADTVINMTGGGQMILVGVQMSSLTPGWIFGG